MWNCSLNFVSPLFVMTQVEMATKASKRIEVTHWSHREWQFHLLHKEKKNILFKNIHLEIHLKHPKRKSFAIAQLIVLQLTPSFTKTNNDECCNLQCLRCNCVTVASQRVFKLGIFSRTFQDGFISSDEVCSNGCCSPTRVQ